MNIKDNIININITIPVGVGAVIALGFIAAHYLG